MRRQLQLEPVVGRHPDGCASGLPGSYSQTQSAPIRTTSTRRLQSMPRITGTLPPLERAVGLRYDALRTMGAQNLLATSIRAPQTSIELCSIWNADGTISSASRRCIPTRDPRLHQRHQPCRRKRLSTGVVTNDYKDTQPRVGSLKISRKRQNRSPRRFGLFFERLAGKRHFSSAGYQPNPMIRRSTSATLLQPALKN